MNKLKYVLVVYRVLVIYHFEFQKIDRAKHCWVSSQKQLPEFYKTVAFSINLLYNINITKKEGIIK